MDAGPVRIDKHEPERRRQTPITMHVGCCCSCLHTLGAIIGAVAVPLLRRPKETPNQVKFGISAIALFWSLSAILVMMVFLCSILSDPSNEEMIRETAFGVMCAFPGIQLLSVFLGLVVFLIWPRTDWSRQLDVLGELVVGIMLGSAIGGGLMLVAAIGFAMFWR